jgi:rRNA maturation protein Nop10
MQCPACGRDELIKYGFTSAGKQRWECRHCGNVAVIAVPEKDGPSTTFLATWLRRVEARLAELEEKVAFQQEEITRLEMHSDTQRSNAV